VERNVQPLDYFPHVDLLARALRINRERLNGQGKIAIDARLLRRIIQCAIERLPFSAAFYQATYPDIAAAAAAGQIPDLHRHYVETGYFEGRHGCPPAVEEAFYRATYKDVAEAIAQDDIVSGNDHYMLSGAAEGRVPRPDLARDVADWMGILRMPVMAEP
jgi:hypothetical protein